MSKAKTLDELKKALADEFNMSVRGVAIEKRRESVPVTCASCKRQFRVGEEMLAPIPAEGVPSMRCTDRVGCRGRVDEAAKVDRDREAARVKHLLETINL